MHNSWIVLDVLQEMRLRLVGEGKQASTKARREKTMQPGFTTFLCVNGRRISAIAPGLSALLLTGRS